MEHVSKKIQGYTKHHTVCGNLENINTYAASESEGKLKQLIQLLKPLHYFVVANRFSYRSNYKFHFNPASVALL